MEGGLATGMWRQVCGLIVLPFLVIAPCALAAPSRPDLVVTKVGATLASGHVDVSVTVANKGKGRAGRFDVRVVASADAKADKKDIALMGKLTGKPLARTKRGVVKGRRPRPQACRAAPTP